MNIKINADNIQNPIISIVLCTYNNAESLDITLKQINKCKIPISFEVELLIIDNNSPDKTQNIINNHLKSTSLPCKSIFEPRQGLSYARNTGLEQAIGTYILFTDDDATIPIDWLSLYIEKIKDTSADCLYSKIEIEWDQVKPWWFDSRYNPFFVHLNYGETPIEVTDIHHEFYGKNFCIKKSILINFGGFDPNLGRIGSKLVAGEETLIYRKLIKNNYRVFYFPEATVGHRLKPREYLASNIEKQFIDSADSTYYLSKCEAQRLIFNRPAYTLKNALFSIMSSSFKLMLSILKSDSIDTFYYKLRLKRSIKILKLWRFNA